MRRMEVFPVTVSLPPYRKRETERRLDGKTPPTQHGRIRAGGVNDMRRHIAPPGYPLARLRLPVGRQVPAEPAPVSPGYSGEGIRKVVASRRGIGVLRGIAGESLQRRRKAVSGFRFPHTL